MYDVFFTILVKFGRDNVYQNEHIFFVLLLPPPTPLSPEKNLAVTACSTEHYLACDMIAQQGAIFDEIISKQALNIDQVIQINV